MTTLAPKSYRQRSGSDPLKRCDYLGPAIKSSARIVFAAFSPRSVRLFFFPSR